MGRYSSDSDNSRSSRARKSKRSSGRSSKARSRSRSPKRCKKKLKKYKRSNRSLSRDPKSRHSSDRKSKYRHRSRSHSNSPSDRRRKRSNSRDSDRDRRRRDHKKTKSKRRHRSSSSSSTSSSSASSKSKSSTPKRKFDYDPDELLEKLNKAAVEAMAANKKIKPDSLSSIEMQIKRQDIINELRGNSSCSLTGALNVGPSLAPPTVPAASLLSSKISEKLGSDDSPIIVDMNAASLSSSTNVTSSTCENLLHPNFLLENLEEKLNRWVKKLYQIRQRAMNGDMP